MKQRLNQARPRDPILRLISIAALLALVVAAPGSARLAAPSAGHAFPGRNGEILYISQRVGNHPTQLYLMRPNGTHQRRLGSERHVWAPAWSPDGKWIAYVKGGLCAQLYLMRADGSHVRRLTHDRNCYSDPTWAPDGTRIAFASWRRDGLPGIWTMNLNGTGLRLLTDKGDSPAWSPDGTTIAYRSRYPEAIWLMNPDGSNQRQLTMPLQRKAAQSDVDMQPDWSPNSKWVAFSRQHPANREWQRDIFVVRSDGSGLRQLTSHHHQNGWAAWSPDATRIAFWSDRDHRDLGDIYVMKANGSGQTRLTRGHSDQWPEWRPLRAAPDASHRVEGER